MKYKDILSKIIVAERTKKKYISVKIQKGQEAILRLL